MKKTLILLASFLLFIGAAYAGNFSAVKKAGDVMVKVSIDNNPLSVGTNNAFIELDDGTGQTITNAEVKVYYFMTSMPAMNYEIEATMKGNKYVAVIKPTMPGAWDADIKVKVAGGDQQKATISFEAK